MTSPAAEGAEPPPTPATEGALRLPAPSGPTGGAGRLGLARSGSPEWLPEALGAQLKVIIAVDERDLATDPAGEGGNHPVTDALRSRGSTVADLTHHRRAFGALQRTILEYRDPQCAVLGCTATARLEHDHRADWAATLTTDAGAADRLCHAHHELKTLFGWHLEPGTGKRRMLPPSR